jgi:hypothetical protein
MTLVFSAICVDESVTVSEEICAFGRSEIGRQGRWVAQRSFWRGAVEAVILTSRFYTAEGGRDMEEEGLDSYPYMYGDY